MIKIKTSQLKNKFQLLNSLATRASLPILNNILIYPEKKIAKAVATDLETTIILPIDAKCEEKMLLPSQALTKIVNLAQEDIFIEQKENIATINLENTKFELALPNANEFPTLPSLETKSFINIQAQDLKTGINKVIFATEKTRGDYYSPLNNVNFIFDSSQLQMTASNRVILAVANIPCSGSIESKNCLVPTPPLLLLSKLLANQEINLSITESTIIFKTDEFLIISQLTDQKFPDIASVLEEKSKIHVSVLKDSFIDALIKASIAAEEKVILEFNEDKITVSSNSDLGSVVSTIDIKTSEGADLLPLKFGFNRIYLSNIIKRLGETIHIGLLDPRSPVYLNTDEALKYVIMPLELHD